MASPRCRATIRARAASVSWARGSGTVRAICSDSVSLSARSSWDDDQLSQALVRDDERRVTCGVWSPYLDDVPPVRRVERLGGGGGGGGSPAATVRMMRVWSARWRARS